MANLPAPVSADPGPALPAILVRDGELIARYERRRVDDCILRGGDPKAEGLGPHGSMIGGPGKLTTVHYTWPERTTLLDPLPLSWWAYPRAQLRILRSTRDAQGLDQLPAPQGQPGPVDEVRFGLGRHAEWRAVALVAGQRLEGVETQLGARLDRARQDRKDMEGRLMAAIEGKPPKGP